VFVIIFFPVFRKSLFYRGNIPTDAVYPIWMIFRAIVFIKSKTAISVRIGLQIDAHMRD